MAVFKTKFPIDRLSGVLGHLDRTVGIDGGLSIGMQERRHSGHLVAKTQSTRGGSEARHERAVKYCACDAEYKEITKAKRSWIWGYWLNQKGMTKLKATNYAIWMTMCLADLYQRKLFRAYSYLARYWIENTTAEVWTDKIIKLLDVSTKLPSGKDVIVWQISPQYDLGPQLDQKVEVVGEVLVKVPSLAAGDGFLADLYSYGDYETVEGW